MDEILKILNEYEALTATKKTMLKEEIKKADKRRGYERLRKAILEDSKENIKTDEEITTETKSILKELISSIDEINKAGVSGVEFVYRKEKRGSYKIKREIGRTETVITVESNVKAVLSYTVCSYRKETAREVNILQPSKSTVQLQNEIIKAAKNFFDENADDISDSIMKITGCTIKPVNNIKQFLKPSKKDHFL